ncbi:RbsD/FucU family protein [Calycomorphotria hydatis]|uniref:L-fucose mutarotase n=1 Tax=Calycomorphotria hydatis TaxID=2528027 RepID=A0A517TAT8_9PLAN|nr:RbsD/FucU family protein [Calycomorphotria hydatis]QDT65480.1 L-fucose mutarotase [Calycomorphotria hydatis]
MLKTPLLHPEILRVVANAGHHARILIADGNYPGATKKGPNAELVPLQLSPGIPTVTDVLKALLPILPVDGIHTMGIPEDDPYAAEGEPPVWSEYRDILGELQVSLELKPILKWDFYKEVESPDHILTIQTADQALWANVLLVVGCRTE